MKDRKRNIWIIDDVYGAEDTQGASFQRQFARFARDDVAFHFFSGKDAFLDEYALSAVEGYMRRTDLARPDLILLDVNFGALPLGYDFLDWFVATHPSIPIVMFTSLERDANLKHALNHGAVDFISKSETSVATFWSAIERYLAPDPNDWLIGHHGQFLQALYLMQRFAYGDRRHLLLQGAEQREKNAAVAYMARLLSTEPLTINSRNAEVSAKKVASAKLIVIEDADASSIETQRTLTEMVGALPATTRVITTTTDYLAAQVKLERVDRTFYDLISENVAHIPNLRERLSDVTLLLRRALLIAATARKERPSTIPDWVVARTASAATTDTLSDLDDVADAILRYGANRDTLERELEKLLGPPAAGVRLDPASNDSREQISDVERFLERVASHKSAYTIEHDGDELVVFPNVFSPRYSHSSDFLIEMLQVRQGDRVIDIGCGTGVLGIAALRRGADHATFVDVNPDAAANTQANLDKLGYGARGRIVLSDVYQNVEGKFDLIVSNPPFWNKPAKTMLERSCFDENYAFLRKLIEGAANRAGEGARLAIVMSNQSDTALVQRLLSKYGWVARDHRMAPARSGRGGSNHVRVAWICDRTPEP